METKDIILKLRLKQGLSQEELAEKVYVTRQAVSRWENGETVPNTETLKMLSMLFGVSINTLLGSPRKLICQCCGMPLEDEVMSREPDGAYNEEYCKWCYADGKFAIQIWRLWLISAQSICRMRNGRRIRPGLILRKYCQNLVIGDNRESRRRKDLQKVEEERSIFLAYPAGIWYIL